MTYISGLPESSEPEHPPGVVCDGNECHLVEPQPQKSFEERQEAMRRRIEQSRQEKDVAERERMRQQEKERIERGKAMQATKEELAVAQRQREIERQRREKEAEEVCLWRLCDVERAQAAAGAVARGARSSPCGGVGARAICEVDTRRWRRRRRRRRSCWRSRWRCSASTTRERAR